MTELGNIVWFSYAVYASAAFLFVAALLWIKYRLNGN